MAPVKLYVYDLSNGLARSLSRQLTGRQIDGIWHTSVVVFGREVFYGQGIDITPPGRSHHGTPLQILDMGETGIDEETFHEYIEEVREHYTAEKYHLLEFNCNSFTNDCVGFLTGGSIPDYIKDLPSDFLSTPFGASLRPTIDAMYRRPSPGAPAAYAPTGQPDLASSLLQTVAAQAQSAPSSASTSTTAPMARMGSLTSPIHACTNPASFHTLLRTHRAVVADFTDATCGPCRMIAPVFERLAEEKGVHANGGRGAAFVSVDIRVGQGHMLAAEWGIRATPTFMFFLDGKKISDLKGADQNGLRTQVDLLLFQAYPPHPHTSLSLPAVEAVSLKPILFTQVPPLDNVIAKLLASVQAAAWPTDPVASTVALKKMVPYLKSRNESATSRTALPAQLKSWNDATVLVAKTLPASTLFPLADMWRLALLDPAVGTWCTSATAGGQPQPLGVLIPLAREAVSDAACRNFLLTTLRMVANAFCHVPLARSLLTSALRAEMTALMVPSLLHDNAQVRTAAASLVFNVAVYVQQRRVDSGRTGGGGFVEGVEQEDDDWEVEMVSAVIEALDREKTNEDAVHRLVASLAFFLRLSPGYESQLAPLIEVLQLRSILRSKLTKDGFGENGVVRRDVRKLIEEIAVRLCPSDS
ncbi:DUF862-domain-containing protein [Fistulina hepatica ATCC 64428]|uniref:DUF862-domain-containing protein n=1 Tax=Fistulina hepatica ATCC 64428 TaxID=1128425 RepID=A0A0D7A5J5_9AGAR|nr:DUF862-domain-containing protein [Fistulina hepatica ATCC 64428]